jgi:hypothetical protein
VVTDAGRWARVKAVFEEALAREAVHRATYLDNACGSDHALRAEVESLLVAHHEAGRFAEGLPLDALPVSAVASLADRLGRGTRLGPYEILAKVGEGGMGEVYRAHDIRLDRAVAIKVLPAEFAADPDRLARFEREARATAALNHPNIVAVYDVGTLGDMSYLVTELLEGQTLRSVLGGTRLPVTRAVEYGAQVARALGAAHDRGIMHRDLKPENLFLTRDGRIKILDFGLAKLIEPDQRAPVEATEPGKVLGTVAYMSPEQARGEAVDQRTDIFSLGAVLYELIAGRRAFSGATQADVLSAIIKDEPPSLGELGRPIPPVVDRIVGRCLEKDRDARFRTAHDLAFALEALSGPVVSAGPSQPARRRWLKSVAFGTGWVVAGAGSAIGLIEWLRETPSPPLYTQLTFRRGRITGARFAPDGETVVYSASWDGEPGRVFTTRIGGRESRDLEIEGLVWGVSATGDVAVKTGQLRSPQDDPGVLARVSLAGGAPRELLGNVTAAAWSPAGRDLAVARVIDDRTVLEYPMGRALYRTTGSVVALCVLPDGAVALHETAAETGEYLMSLVDVSGARRVLSGGWRELGRAMAWSASTNEVVFSGWKGPGDISINAVTTSDPARTRLVARVPVDIWVQDVDRRGRILLTRNLPRGGVLALAPGNTQEREVSWLDFSSVIDLSDDGRLIVLADFGGELGATGGGIGIRTTEGGPITDLGRGNPLALSADNRHVLALPSIWIDSGDRLFVIPVGAGERRELRHPSLVRIFAGSWFRDARRLVVVAGQEAQRSRLFVWDTESGAAPQPISDEGTFGHPSVSPDGNWVTAAKEGVPLSIYPIAGGTPRTLPDGQTDDRPLRWSTDGKWLFVRRGPDAGTVAIIERVEVATGQRSRWKELRPAVAGVFGINHVAITPDGSGYAYTFSSAFGTLYLVEGLK